MGGTEPEWEHAAFSPHRAQGGPLSCPHREEQSGLLPLRTHCILFARFQASRERISLPLSGKTGRLREDPSLLGKGNMSPDFEVYPAGSGEALKGLEQRRDTAGLLSRRQMALGLSGHPRENQDRGGGGGGAAPAHSLAALSLPCLHQGPGCPSP